MIGFYRMGDIRKVAMSCKRLNAYNLNAFPLTVPALG